MRKFLITITLITFLFMGQSTLASVHLEPKPLKKPADLTYQVGSTGNTLVWQYEAHESNDVPGTYSVFKDNVVLEDHNDLDWGDKEELTIVVDGLAIGTYTYKIEVTDQDTIGNDAVTATDEAIVTVVATLASTSSSTPVASSTSTAESSTESDSSILFVPVIAMLFAIGVGVPILKYRNIKK